MPRDPGFHSEDSLLPLARRDDRAPVSRDIHADFVRLAGPVEELGRRRPEIELLEIVVLPHFREERFDPGNQRGPVVLGEGLHGRAVLEHDVGGQPQDTEPRLHEILKDRLKVPGIIACGLYRRARSGRVLVNGVEARQDGGDRDDCSDDP